MKRAMMIILAAVVGACTAVHYESPRLAERPPDRETIAVMPFEMVFAGKLPPDLGPEQIRAIEAGESLAFQHALYNRLLDRSSVKRSRPILVRIQPVETTNRLLDEGGIELREAWQMPAEELAETLGVQAVLRTRVEKTRYMSELASWGTELGLHVLHEASKGRIDWLIPPGLTRTDDIYADSTLVSCEDGDLLWKVAVHRATDWRRPANDVVAG
ncbi:MAG: hypothetical protein ACE5EG_11815, partial [Thermoanaerobaculia bacterium]